MHLGLFCEQLNISKYTSSQPSATLRNTQGPSGAKFFLKKIIDTYNTKCMCSALCGKYVLVGQ